MPIYLWPRGGGDHCGTPPFGPGTAQYFEGRALCDEVGNSGWWLTPSSANIVVNLSGNFNDTAVRLESVSPAYSNVTDSVMSWTATDSIRPSVVRISSSAQTQQQRLLF